MSPLAVGDRDYELHALRRQVRDLEQSLHVALAQVAEAKLIAAAAQASADRAWKVAAGPLRVRSDM